jgi:hypothetical protein
MRKRATRAALVGALALTAACDGRDGPGYLAGALEGPLPLGAAVVDVRGIGIMGFEPVGTTRVFSAVTPEGVHRVVLVGETAGDLSFRIQVEDPRAAPPVGVLVSAADAEDRPVTSVTPFSVRITR